MSTTFDRLRRATLLDAKLYQEVEENTDLNQEALLIVVAVSLLSGIGALIGGIIGGGIGTALLAAVITVIVGIVNYYIWSYVTYYVGTRLFEGTADPGEMLRVLGYAQTPRLLGLLSFIPCVGWLFNLAGLVLSLIASIIGIREALDFDTGNAVITAIVGWLIVLVVSVVVNLVFGVGAIGLGALGSVFGG
jgi:hypothetical protein